MSSRALWRGMHLHGMPRSHSLWRQVKLWPTLPRTRGFALWSSPSAIYSYSIFLCLIVDRRKSQFRWLFGVGLLTATWPQGRSQHGEHSARKMATGLSVTGDVAVYDLSIPNRAKAGEMPAVDDGDGQRSEALQCLNICRDV